MVGKVTITVTTRLERFLRRNKILPKHLAEASGVHRNQLVEYRQGKSSPTIPVVRKLLKGLHKMGYPCKANDLFPLDDDD